MKEKNITYNKNSVITFERSDCLFLYNLSNKVIICNIYYFIINIRMFQISILGRNGTANIVLFLKVMRKNREIKGELRKIATMWTNRQFILMNLYALIALELTWPGIVELYYSLTIMKKGLKKERNEFSSRK